MKALILAMILVATVDASAQVRGRPVPAGVPGGIINPNTFAQSARLTNLRMDRNHEANGKIVSADIEVNAVKRRVKLTLNPKEICPRGRPGQITCLGMLSPTIIELPLIETKTDYCGAKVYVAKQDRRPVDGSLQIIEVTDNRFMTCEIVLAPYRMTEVVYTSEGLRSGIRAKSELSGEALKNRLGR